MAIHQVSARAFDLRSDELRDELSWQQVEQAILAGPSAQRKAFWTELSKYLETDHRLLSRQNVQLIAAPLQECVALHVDALVRQELSNER